MNYHHVLDKTIKVAVRPYGALIRNKQIFNTKYTHKVNVSFTGDFINSGKFKKSRENIS